MDRVLIFNPSTPQTFQESHQVLYQIYIVLFYLTSAVLTAFFALSLYTVYKNSKQKFAVQLLALMLVSNITIIVSMLTYAVVIEAVNTGQVLGVYLWVMTVVALICFVVSNATFNIATWLLAFNYFMCSQKLDKNGLRKAKSKRMEVFYNALYWGLLALNALFATLWGVLKFWRNYKRYLKDPMTGDNVEFYT